MRLPWKSAALSTSDGGRQPAQAVDTRVRGSDLDTALAALRAEAAVALIGYTQARKPDGYDKASHVRELMSALGLSPASFRGRDRESTVESFLFTAAEQAGESLDGWELDLQVNHLARSMRSNRGHANGAYEISLQDVLDKLRAEHRHHFGRELKVGGSAEILESRLGAYARLLHAHKILDTSRLSVHPDVLSWAEQIGAVERQLGEALNARREQHDRLVRSKATAMLPAAGTLGTIFGGLTGLAAAQDSPPGTAFAGLLTALTSAYVGRVLVERGDIGRKAEAAKRAARSHNAQLHRLLNATPSGRGR